MLNARNAFLAIALCAGCVVWGCGATKQGLGLEAKVVAVSWNGSDVVCNPDPVYVKKDTQKVTWTSADELRITLETQPTKQEVDCKQAGSSGWRCESKTFASIGRIKYDASVKVGGVWKTVDPIIDVGP